MIQSYYPRVKALLELREEYLSQNDHQQAQKIEDEINARIYTAFEFLECDYVLEILTHLGYAPNLLNNDERQWHVTDECVSTLTYDNTFQQSFRLDNIQWYATIREALYEYYGIIIEKECP